MFGLWLRSNVDLGQLSCILESCPFQQAGDIVCDRAAVQATLVVSSYKRENTNLHGPAEFGHDR